ncbi:restriction endonuclease subunit S [Marivirga tractuosa]|uniref:restriction endonuclease subunit S n=1 Tax=Marivirga tractuosa TaxID=1006 RepID=UPI0035CF6E1A
MKALFKMSEVMDKKDMLVPELRFREFEGHWFFKSFGDISRFINGRAYKQSELLDKGKYKVLRVGNLFSNKEWYYSDLELEDDKYIDAGDLMYAWSASFGSYYWNGEKTIYHYHIWKVIPKDSISRDFLYQLFLFDLEKIKLQSQGGTMFHITKGNIENRKIKIPAFPEQQKIADFLSAVDQKIQQLHRKKELLAQYKKGIMQKLFAQEIRFKDDQGNDFPEWEWVGGNKLFDNISNKDHNSDLPILAITQDQGAIPRDMIDYQMTVTEKSIASYKVVEVGDFVISLRTFQGGIEYSNYKGICSPAYIILRPSSESVDRTFYKFYLKTEKYIRQLQRNLEGIRDGKMISFKYFSEINLPYPSLAEQQIIANFLSSLDEKVAQVGQQISQAQRFKKGLLQKMFV